MAVNFSVVPVGILDTVGCTSIDTSAVAPTVRAVESEMPPNSAVIVVVPVETEAANPLKFAALPIVATLAADEIQLTDAVMSLSELSENVPVAVNCSVVPSAMLDPAGVMAIDRSVADGVPDPLPLVQPATRSRTSKKSWILLDFINNHSWRY